MNPNTKLKLNHYFTYRSDNDVRWGKSAYGGTVVIVHDIIWLLINEIFKII